MADNVLGSISIVITGDTSQFDAALARAMQSAQKAGASIAASLNSSAANANVAATSVANVEAAIERLTIVIQQESAASTLALQRSIALQGGLQNLSNTAGIAAQTLQNGLQGVADTSQAAAQGAIAVGRGATSATGGLRYMIFAAKDLAEGRTAYAMAEVVNVLLRLGPAALAAGGAIAAIGLAAYQIHKIPENVEAARGAYAELNLGLETTNDELQLANDKLDNQIAKLTGAHENVLKEMIDEAAAATDLLASKLDSALKALIDIQKKEQIGFFGAAFTNQGVSTDFAKKLGGLSGQGGERAEIRSIENTARARIAAARENGDLEAANGVRAETRNALQSKYNDLIDQASFELGVLNRSQDAKNFLLPDQSKNIELVSGLIENLKAQSELVGLDFANVTKKQDLSALKGGENVQRGDPAGIARIKAAEAEVQGRAELARRIVEIQSNTNRQLAQINIDGIADAGARTLAADLADIAQARSKQAQLIAIAKQQHDAQIALIPQLAEKEKKDKSPEQQAAIQIASQEKISAANRTLLEVELAATANTTSKVNKLREDAAAWQRRLIEDAEKFIESQADKEIERARRLADARARVAEIGEKSKGETNALGFEAEKLRLEQAYGLAVIHTGQQQLALQRQIAEIDAAARQAKIDGLKNEQSDVPDNNDPKNIAKIAEIQAQIDQAQAQARNADIQANTKILQQQQLITIQYQLRAALAHAGAAIPGALGGALAAGIVGGHGQQNIGQQIAQALRGVGQQLLGGVFTSLIHQLITTLLASTVAQHVMTAIFGTQVGVQAANTAAVTANAAASTALVVSNAVMVPTMAVMTTALIANTIALYTNAATNLIGGFADGGSPPVGVPSIVGERGPEIFVPRGAGTIIPNHMIKKYADGAGLDQLPAISQVQLGSPGTSNSSSTALSIGAINVHGVQNPRQFAELAVRHIPKVLKARGAGFSPMSK